jgi:hypothetical protein
MGENVRQLWIMNILSVITVAAAVIAVVGASLGWWSWK